MALARMGVTMAIGWHRGVYQYLFFFLLVSVLDREHRLDGNLNDRVGNSPDVNGRLVLAEAVGRPE